MEKLEQKCVPQLPEERKSWFIIQVGVVVVEKGTVGEPLDLDSSAVKGRGNLLMQDPQISSLPTLLQPSDRPFLPELGVPASLAP